MASTRENPSRKGKYRCRVAGCDAVFDLKYQKNLHVAFAHNDQSQPQSQPPPPSTSNALTNGNTNGNIQNNIPTNPVVTSGWAAINKQPRPAPVIPACHTTTNNQFRAMNQTAPKQYQSPYASQTPVPITVPAPVPAPQPQPAPPQIQIPQQPQFSRPKTYQSPYAPLPSPLPSLQTHDTQNSPSIEDSRPKTPGSPTSEPLTPICTPLPSAPSSPLSWGGSQTEFRGSQSPTPSDSDTIELLADTTLMYYETKKFGPGTRKYGFRCLACNVTYGERSELSLHTAFVHRGVRKLMIGTSMWGTWDVELRDEGGYLPVVRNEEGGVVDWRDVWDAR
ncbi:hypothetical protein HYFRA_00001712 [Hymenoscyphus fraxineus]|uniref:C2H2-type domain-containing protein n=1 Tax=Hymenoscyphus fraxineus TaxID=746836 RepID=A0A9N9L5D8_9HELO|nr:hypothetical protein HYFRA_00001712 [Hymenoscyphus fraxineus]